MKQHVPPGYIANFDSASAMIRATARFLKGKDFPTVGLQPESLLKAIMPLANQLPDAPREVQYAAGGWGEAVSPQRLGQVKAERVAEWMTGLYPSDRKFPALMIGSSAGALVHLCAALGIPWLPQTFLIPVSQMGVHPDDAGHGMDAAIKPAQKLLEANPELQLHHMHDPNQDRLMLHLMTYFRVKWRRLSAAFEEFITSALEPGGTLFIPDCRRTWPCTRLSERHIFQMGALGGATPDEFLHGSDRVDEYLTRYKSHRRQWHPPIPNEDAPEAEWGFEPAIMNDLERLAQENGYRIVRIGFEEPEHLSPLVADLYRWWYKQRNIPANRLLVESFLLIEPWWALRTGSVPFWMKFNMEPSFDYLNEYLDAAAPYDHINMMLFNHGVDCIGKVELEEWQQVLTRANKDGSFLGLEEDEYPKDFASFAHYHSALQDVPSRYSIPGPLSLKRLDEFLRERGDRYQVEWSEEVTSTPV